MPANCARCATPLADGALDCASCHALVHAERLKTLAADAETAADPVPSYRAMLELLPASSRQHALVAAKLAAFQPVPGQQAPKRRSANQGGLAAATGALVLGLSKIKSLIPTVATMVLAFGAYWAAYGWQFAGGLVMSIWIHEMGHVVELRRHGIRASLPMFIPGVGAFVRLRQSVTDPKIDARIGLAGPIAGLGAALLCLAVYGATGSDLWLGLTQVGGLINLFNLTPLFTLDGGRAFNALSKPGRMLITVAFGAGLFLTSNGLLWLPLIGGLTRMFSPTAPPETDRWTLVVFLVLIASLTALAAIPRPV